MIWYQFLPAILVVIILIFMDFFLFYTKYRKGFVAIVRWLGRKIHRAFYGSRDAEIAELREKFLSEGEKSRTHVKALDEEIRRLTTLTAQSEETARQKGHAADQAQTRIQELLAELKKVDTLNQAYLSALKSLIHTLVLVEELPPPVAADAWRFVRGDLQGALRPLFGGQDWFDACQKREFDKIRVGELYNRYMVRNRDAQ